MNTTNSLISALVSLVLAASLAGCVVDSETESADGEGVELGLAELSDSAAEHEAAFAAPAASTEAGATILDARGCPTAYFPGAPLAPCGAEAPAAAHDAAPELAGCDAPNLQCPAGTLCLEHGEARVAFCLPEAGFEQLAVGPQPGDPLDVEAEATLWQ